MEFRTINQSKIRRWVPVLLAVALVATMLLTAPLTGKGTQAYAASTPAFGDTVYFGRYPQGLVNASNPTERPAVGKEGVDWVRQTVKLYRTSYTSTFGDPSDGQDAYYKIEPIAWRVLDNRNGKLFLLAQDIIDAKPYHVQQVPREDMTWETCTIRSWLNGYTVRTEDASVANPYEDSFIGKAFTAGEGSAVATTALNNPNNTNLLYAEAYGNDYWYDTPGGNDTNDKVFFLSLVEIIDNQYGFNNVYRNNDTARRAKTTPFARANYGYTGEPDSIDEGGHGYWWLRSPGISSYSAAFVTYSGNLYVDDRNPYPGIAVRPALNLNMSAVTLTDKGSGVWTATASDTPSSAQQDNSTVEPIANPSTAAIQPSSLTGATVAPIANAQWTGRQITPSVTVKLDNKTLEAGTDYTVTYGENKNIGIGIVTITGKGSYADSKMATFNIVPQKTSIKTAKAGKRQVKLTWAKAAAAQKISGYEIRYKSKNSKKWAVKTAKAKATYLTVKGLKKGKVYQFKIRAYKSAHGAKYFAPWSTTKTCRKVK
ncbi:MAG: fibronectin type III domain-containing protein [Clostridiales Family XIII bacterium]|jgi:hypothetical protein|nr:fibronectin type III domain-containing protein [Clostridiales Family XIII bacterium]